MTEEKQKPKRQWSKAQVENRKAFGAFSHKQALERRANADGVERRDNAKTAEPSAKPAQKPVAEPSVAEPSVMKVKAQAQPSAKTTQDSAAVAQDRATKPVRHWYDGL